LRKNRIQTGAIIVEAVLLAAGAGIIAYQSMR
jgi:hypothetical protein